jgi:superoxide dismutase, Cu-Zn family
MKIRSILSAIILLIPAMAMADIVVPIHLTSNNQNIGNVTLKETPKGLEFTANLHDLPPGQHGFHVHENESCDHHGDAAGGHLDPHQTGKHLGPYKNGHLGDLPVLDVAKDGTATGTVIAPRLKMNDVIGHSLMIHEGGDNYADTPKKLGGGGARIACGSVSAADTATKK